MKQHSDRYECRDRKHPDEAQLIQQFSRWAGALASPIEGRIVLGPNWFASVMGTGIIAIAAATLPVKFTGLFEIATVAWLLASFLLTVLLIVIPLHWYRQRGTFTALTEDPVAVQFFGAPPMALMTVGTATLLVGSHYIGQPTAVMIDSVLWTCGTVAGYITAIVVPYRLFSRLELSGDSAFGGWLMPVVPPMVSAAAGALLVPHAPAGILRESLLLACYSMFGMSLVVSLIVITLIWSRLVHFGSSGSARVPTLWIVLGPVGQSITAAGGLGIAAATAAPEQLASAFKFFAVLYGAPMWGFIWLWMPIAILLTIRARNKQMGFALTWWSFTFPVGTCVTGTSQLAHHTGLPMFQWSAVLLFTALLIMWGVVLVRTAKGALRGGLLTPALGSPAPKASKG
jgi:C4-dicarboxylate transporter/malic acid transport protein